MTRRATTLAMLLLLAALSPASSFGQASTISVLGGLSMPAPIGDEIVPQVKYKDLYGSGISLGVQYRYLLWPHLSAVAEVSRVKLSVNPEQLKSVVDIGNLELEGGDMERLKGAAGLAWETNKDEGPNIFIKALFGYYRSKPDNVLLTAPETGEIFTESFATVYDIGINFGVGVEIPVKPRVALLAGADVDMLIGSELFNSTRKQTLWDMNIRAGISYYF